MSLRLLVVVLLDIAADVSSKPDVLRDQSPERKEAIRLERESVLNALKSGHDDIRYEYPENDSSFKSAGFKVRVKECGTFSVGYYTIRKVFFR